MACFDRQVNSHTIINSRKYEVPDQACKRLSVSSHQTKYHVKTSLGVSDTLYGSTPDYLHYILGQGSECASTTWLFESTPMLKTVEKIYKDFGISPPDHSLSYTIHIIGLVDDRRKYANDWRENSETTICDNLQRGASSWEQILHTFGGSLELTKWACYLITWEFTNSGLPYINKKSTKPFFKRYNKTNDTTVIKYRTIQVFRSNISSWWQSTSSVPSYHTEWKNRLHHHFIQPLHSSSSFFYLISYLLPKLTPPLKSAAFDTKQYNQIEGAFRPCVITAMRYNRKWPITLRYGTHQYGGLQMKSLEVKAFIKKFNVLNTHA